MKRDYKLYLNDICESINIIEKYIRNISEEVFKRDIKLQDAVVRRFEIIGEASRNIPRALKDKNPQVPWYKMEQFRDLMTHSYFEISINKIWMAIINEIPRIKEAMKNISLV